ncbi:MAG: ATP-dependent Clp protease adapter ClpS [Verrucomicrobia bacterium]|jgi:ATP-dependent Clp protease adaptor protein ClpS|nr:ATP-dependent Clp protease adapter ClpS [Verrucomicrobiota bacterium]
MSQPGLLDSPEISLSESLDLPWLVVVHNDPVNLMSYVTMVFCRVFGWNRERAKKHMMEVHRLGRSMVWSGGREQAEHYVQQLHTFLLLATMEKST